MSAFLPYLCRVVCCGIHDFDFNCEKRGVKTPFFMLKSCDFVAHFRARVGNAPIFSGLQKKGKNIKNCRYHRQKIFIFLQNISILTDWAFLHRFFALLI